MRPQLLPREEAQSEAVMTHSKDNHPARRATDKPWRIRLHKAYCAVRNALFGPSRAYRDIWLLVVTILVLFAVSSVESDVERQREGRELALRANCGFNQAIIDGGRLIISQSTEDEDFANQYVEYIAASVTESSGIDNIIDPDTAQIDCDRLAQLANVNETAD